MNVSVVIRPMTAEDIPAGLRLSQLAGWNQMEADWRLCVDTSWSSAYAAVSDNQIVGTVATLRYGRDLGWIGMMLVDPEFRRQGIGGRLLDCALERLVSCHAVKLDATPLGRPLYVSRGFVAESSLQRLTHSCLPALPRPIMDETVALPIDEEAWPAVVAWDEAGFGANRAPLLQAMRDNDPAHAFYLRRNQRIVGFCCGRPGANYHQIGPIIAHSTADAILLTQAALYDLAGRPVALDTPSDAPLEFLWRLHDQGFMRQRPFLRMVHARGNATPSVTLRNLFAICGPEFG